MLYLKRNGACPNEKCDWSNRKSVTFLASAVTQNFLSAEHRSAASSHVWTLPSYRQEVNQYISKQHLTQDWVTALIIIGHNLLKDFRWHSRNRVGKTDTKADDIHWHQIFLSSKPSLLWRRDQQAKGRAGYLWIGELRHWSNDPCGALVSPCSHETDTEIL